MVTSDLGACEWFVWDLRRSGLIERGQLDQTVGEFLRRNPRAEAPALAEYLVDHGALTPFQVERVLNGKTQGLVLGPYVLLDAIGSGSMGQVYKASSKNDEALYAVKVLPRRSMWNVRLARRQVRSFEVDLDLWGERVRAAFIRAPWVEEVGAGVEVLAEVDGHPIAVIGNNVLAVAFHPEITGETRLHRWLLA